jgi:hypothetical protein
VSRKSGVPAAYHRMSIQQKQAHALGAAREQPVACPSCDTQVMPEDLIAHMDQRCTGPREPVHGSKWLDWRSAIALGVPERTLKRWVQAKHVRYQGGRGDRLYLRRDLVKRLALRRIVSRR